jgi:putative hemolysin
MDEVPIVAWAALAVVGMLLSFLCSGLETGIYTLNPIGLEIRLGRGDPAARQVAREIARPARVIATLLIANNIANYLVSLGIAELLTPLGLGPFASTAVNGLIGLSVGFLLCETLPKDLFRTFTDRWTYLAWPFLRAWRIALTATGVLPLVTALGELVTRRVGGSDEAALSGPRAKVSTLIKEGIDAGVLSERQWTFAERALALRGITVADEMTPWSRVATVAVDADATRRESVLRKSGASRVPVVAADGRVVGVLSTLDAILHPDTPTSRLMTPVTRFPPGESTLGALRTLRAARARLGVVVDEVSGRPRGVVAIKDLVEPITGQLAGS